MEQHVFCPANFLTEAVVVSVVLFSCRPALVSFLATTAQGLGWPGLGWLGWAGLVTEKQQNARVEAEGGWMEWWLGWYWCSEGWETLDRSWRRLVVDGG